MNSVGIDLHRSRSHVAVIDEQGELVLSKRLTNSREAFLELLGGLDGDVQIALEATYGWEWAADLFQQAGYDLHLAHPSGTKAIASARVKNDAVDAKTLAHLLRGGLLPEAYIATPELRDVRDVLRHRIALTQLRTTLKNRVHALLARQGVRRDFPRTSLFGAAGRELIAGFELRPQVRARVESLLGLIADFDREIDKTTREIEALAKSDDRVPVLCQIPGVGRFTAMLIIAEIGEIERFPTARHLCSWVGLTPRVRASDRTLRLGHITRQGSVALRWALGEAAQTAAKSSGPLRDNYERIAKRRGRNIAKIATARKILTLAFYALRDGEIHCLTPRARSRARPLAGAAKAASAQTCAGDADATREPRASSSVVMTPSQQS